MLRKTFYNQIISLLFACLVIFISFNSIAACSSEPDHKKDALKLVTRWCELSEKVNRSHGTEKETAERELKEFEYDMDRKYHRTDAVSREAQDLLDKGCEEILKEK